MLVGKHKDGNGYQYTAIKIAKFLSVNRVTIHRKINEFLEKGLIRCVNPDGNPKLYEETPLKYDAVYGKQLTLDSVESSLLPLQRPSRKIVLQKARYEITIEQEHTNSFEKQTKYLWGKTPCYKFKTKIFDGFGKWVFEKVGKNKKIVL